MPMKSRWSLDIPKCSLPTYFFKSPTEPLSETRRCYLDADDPDNTYFTRAGFRLWCQRLGLGLQRSKHFKKGDRVLLYSGNDMFFPVVFIGTLCAGGIFTGANPGYVTRELAYQLKDSGATYLFCADVSLDTGIEAAKMAGMSLDQVFVFNHDHFDGRAIPPQKGCQHWSTLLASAEEANSFAWDDLRGDASNTTLALNYSSGTTGVPKGVEISHYNYIANTEQFVLQAKLHPDYQARNARSRWLCFLPMYHAMAQAIFLVSSFHRDVPVWIMPKFDFENMLRYLEKYRVTDLILVPPLVVMLIKSPLVKKYDLSSVEFLGSGAAPLSREAAAQAEKLFPGKDVNFVQGWGMTETTCAALGWDSREKCYTSAVGELNANCEGMLIAEDGSSEITARGPDARGELWIRAPNVMKGYWNKPEATKETLTPDGWLKTGDIAYVDEHGKFYIVDRKKELIKVKGNQVAPAELEALLLEHPAVADAAVIGVPTPDGDESPKAYVVLQPDAKKTRPEDIAAFVAKNVARHKRLTAGVEYTDVIPKNPSGKILRRFLRDKAKADAKKGSARL